MRSLCVPKCGLVLRSCIVKRTFDRISGRTRTSVRPFIDVLASIASATLQGGVGTPIAVEVHISNGLPGFTIVGLPDAAVRESRDRVRAAVLSSGMTWPLKRTTINLAPSGVRKGGAGLDLPIAVGLLVAAGELTPACTDGLSFCGELGLNGSLRHVPGMIALADAAGPLWRGRPPLRRPGGGTGARGGGAGHRHVGPARGHPARPGRLARRTSADSAAPHSRPTGLDGRAGAGPGPPGHRGCRGRAPPPPDDRAARLRQDDAGRAPRGTAPAAHPRRGAHGGPHPFGGRLRAARRRAVAAPALPGAPSPGVRRLPGRWGQLVAPSGRGEPGHQRHPVPRRTRRVPGGGAGGVAPAARGGGHPGEPRRRHRDLSGSLPPRCCHEPLPLWGGRLRGCLHLQRRHPRPVPPSHLGSAP